MPRTRHTVSGVVDKNTPEHILDHPVLGKYLEVVEDDAKPLLPVMHRPTTVDKIDDDGAAKPTIPAKKIGKD